MRSLKVENVRLAEGQAVIRERKGRESRVLPLSIEWTQALEVWLKVRKRVIAADDKIDETTFLRRLKCVLDHAGLTKQITLHSLRHYSLNKLAKHNLLPAQQIAGYKSASTTLIYTKLDHDFVRAEHEYAGDAQGVIWLRRESRQRKKLVEGKFWWQHF